MSTKTDITATAARLLGLRFNDAARNSRPLPGEDATYFWNPGRGGGAVIAGSDGRYLFADSSVNPGRHLNEFAAGRRSRPDETVPTAA